MTAPVRLYGRVADRRHPRKRGWVQKLYASGRAEVSWDEGTNSTLTVKRLIAVPAPTRPADGSEAICQGCGALITWDCPPYVPTEFGSWTDCDVVDVDGDGRGDDGRRCVDGEPHRPVEALVAAR